MWHQKRRRHNQQLLLRELRQQERHELLNVCSAEKKYKSIHKKVVVDEMQKDDE